jgi:hypothetical protein
MSESLHPEINSFPVWLYESRVLTHKWANTNIAVIFSYLLARYRFHNEAGRQLYESYEVIAKATGVCVRTAKNAIKTLNENFHIEITKKKSSNGYVNVYVVNDIYRTWEVKKKQSSANSTQPARVNGYNPASSKRPNINYLEVANSMEKEELKRRQKEIEEMDTPF